MMNAPVSETRSNLPPRKAGVIVLRPAAREWRCLLLRAYRNWGFPKGQIEPGETPLQAAVRETAEETAITDLDFCWGDMHIDTIPRAGHKTSRYYIAVSPAGRVHLPVSPELGRPEHHEFRWVAIGTAHLLLGVPLQPVIRWAVGIADTAHARRELSPERRRGDTA
ncbi:MAG TPA: NUDIX domain-containing protein [Burkholderiales bacterium]|jgi:bis(5'-nucleosidyl)-tetraphosphatase|nr:NUDIX domain-containing protein [Burkholderiales bacterium]